jgi:hypothetical protein
MKREILDSISRMAEKKRDENEIKFINKNVFEMMMILD